jgi:hypothetical protein
MDEENTMQISIAIGAVLILVLLVVMALLCGLFGLIVELPAESGTITNLIPLVAG